MGDPLLAPTLPSSTEGFQDVLIAVISQQRWTSFPRARPARCGPQLGSQPTGQTQSCCPIPLPGRLRNEVSSWEPMGQNVGVTSPLKGRRKTWRKVAVLPQLLPLVPSLGLCAAAEVLAPPGGHGGCCRTVVTGPQESDPETFLLKGSHLRKNYTTKFPPLSFNTEHVEQHTGP